MDTIVNLIVVVLVAVVALLVALLILAIGIVWYRRGTRRANEQFGDAAVVVRRWGDDSRPTARLARLADDAWVPGSARRYRDWLIRYRDNPVTLAPEWVPVLGWVDEVAVESFLLRQAWRSLPPVLWAEYFPSPRPARPVEAAWNEEEVAAASSGPRRLGETLGELDRANRHEELLRLLERRMPEWPVGAWVIEVARELAAIPRPGPHGAGVAGARPFSAKFLARHVKGDARSGVPCYD